MHPEKSIRYTPVEIWIFFRLLINSLASLRLDGENNKPYDYSLLYQYIRPLRMLD